MTVTLDETKAHMRGVKPSELFSDVHAYLRGLPCSMYGRAWYITTPDELEAATGWFVGFLEQWANR